MVKNSSTTGLSELASIAKFLKLRPELVGIGLGGILGAVGVAGAMRSIDHAVTWKKVKAMHGHDMAGWEDEAFEIFKKLIKFSPEVIREPELAWGMIANVHRVGGMSYPVAKSIMSTEHMFNQPQIFLPNVPRSLMEDDRPSRRMFKGGSTGTIGSKIGPAKAAISGYLARAWKPALLGATITGIGTFGVQTGATGYHSIMRERGWNKMKAKYSKAISGWEPEARELYDVLYKSSPEIASDPEIALNFITHMRDQGGLDFGTMSDLAALRKGRSARMESKADLISELMGVPTSVTRV